MILDEKPVGKEPRVRSFLASTDNPGGAIFDLHYVVSQSGRAPARFYQVSPNVITDPAQVRALGVPPEAQREGVLLHAQGDDRGIYLGWMPLDDFAVHP